MPSALSRRRSSARRSSHLGMWPTSSTRLATASRIRWFSVPETRPRKATCFSARLGWRAWEPYLLVNHNEQKNVYNEIAVKLDLLDRPDQAVLKPTQFINRFSEKRRTKTGRLAADVSQPAGKADVALIDEVHLLLTQGNQGYQGSNMLLDVMRRAKVTVAVFDGADPGLLSVMGSGRPRRAAWRGGGQDRGLFPRNCPLWWRLL